MSWDIWLEIDAGGDKPVKVSDSHNYTHNTNNMLLEVGFLNEEGGWYGWDKRPCSEFLSALRRAIESLEARPELAKLNPENGWGSYDGLIKKLKEVEDDFESAPNARVRVWA